jgi:hypothetical protein
MVVQDGHPVTTAGAKQRDRPANTTAAAGYDDEPIC